MTRAKWIASRPCWITVGPVTSVKPNQPRTGRCSVAGRHVKLRTPSVGPSTGHALPANPV
jgi:hypothetical protein